MLEHDHALLLADQIGCHNIIVLTQANDQAIDHSDTLIVCGGAVDEDVKNDIAVAGRLGIAATTLDGVLAVKGHGGPGHAGH